MESDIDPTDPHHVAAGWVIAAKHRHVPFTAALLDGLTLPGRADYWGDFGWCEEMLLGFNDVAAGVSYPAERIAIAAFLPEGTPKPPDGTAVSEFPRYRLLTMQANDDGHWQVCSLGDEASELGPNGAYGSAPTW